MVTFTRGATLLFSTTFYNWSRQVVQPSGAQVHIAYMQNGQITTAVLEMTPPVSPAINWTLEWDTRGISPGLVSWFINTEDVAAPYGAEEGEFTLVANTANPLTF